MECIEILLEEVHYLYSFFDFEFTDIHLLKAYDLYPCIWEFKLLVSHLNEHFYNGSTLFDYKDAYKDFKKLNYKSLCFQLKYILRNHIYIDIVNDITVLLYVFLKFELIVCTRKLLYNHSLFVIETEIAYQKPKPIEFINGVSKYCVTNNQFLDFIFAGGYSNHALWSDEGWNYIKSKKIDKPLYNIKNDDYPIVHISYYEAEAYANWKNCRLPSIDEWENMASNGYTTLYPWGDDIFLNNKQMYPVNVVMNQNLDGIIGLVGNCWEWVQSSSEYSYVKGGSWITPLVLCHYKYNNIQKKSTRIQFIGFRLIQR